MTEDVDIRLERGELVVTITSAGHALRVHLFRGGGRSQAIVSTFDGIQAAKRIARQMLGNPARGSVSTGGGA